MTKCGVPVGVDYHLFVAPSVRVVRLGLAPLLRQYAPADSVYC